MLFTRLHAWEASVCLSCLRRRRRILPHKHAPPSASFFSRTCHAILEAYPGSKLACSRVANKRRGSFEPVLSLSHVWETLTSAPSCIVWLHCFLGDYPHLSAWTLLLSRVTEKGGRVGRGLQKMGAWVIPVFVFWKRWWGARGKTRDLERKANDNCTLDRVDPHHKTREGFTVCLEMNRCRPLAYLTHCAQTGSGIKGILKKKESFVLKTTAATRQYMN